MKRHCATDTPFVTNWDAGEFYLRDDRSNSYRLQIDDGNTADWPLQEDNCDGRWLQNTFRQSDRNCDAATGGVQFRVGAGPHTLRLHQREECTRVRSVFIHGVGITYAEPTLTVAPTTAPTTSDPSGSPSTSPTTSAPTISAPTISPTAPPTTPGPTLAPTLGPTSSPTTPPTTSEPTAAPSVPPTASPSEAPAAGPSSHTCDDGTHGCDATAHGICVPLLSPSTGYRCSCADTHRCSDGDCVTAGHACVTANDSAGSGADDGSSESSPFVIALIAACVLVLVGVGSGACIVVKRRSNDPAALRTFANPMYAADEIEGSYGEVVPFSSHGRAGSTTSSSIHLKVDEGLYGGWGGGPETGYMDVAPLPAEAVYGTMYTEADAAEEVEV